jgi:pentapeptide MXKDX repeat protein
MKTIITAACAALVASLALGGASLAQSDNGGQMSTGAMGAHDSMSAGSMSTGAMGSTDSMSAGSMSTGAMSSHDSMSSGAMSGGHSMATTKGKTHKRTHDAMTANNMSTQH